MIGLTTIFWICCWMVTICFHFVGGEVVEVDESLFDDIDDLSLDDDDDDDVDS